jgi:hypothetical protein
MKLKQPESASKTWTRLWLAWIAAFFLIEGSALARHRQQDTLSDHVWVWFDIPRHPVPQRSVRFRRIALLAFFAWLAGHFFTGDEV